MREWCTENGIQAVISPGLAHTRLAILERRPKVTRRSSSLPMWCRRKTGHHDCGFSPIQWTLGYTPHVPGLLIEEQSLDNPAHLDPSEKFMEKLRLKQEAVKTTSEPDTDHRLRGFGVPPAIKKPPCQLNTRIRKERQMMLDMQACMCAYMARFCLHFLFRNMCIYT